MAKLREILELIYRYGFYDAFDKKEKSSVNKHTKEVVDRAISEIKSLLKEKLPKKKVNSIPAPHTPLTESDILAKYMNFGYNFCLSEIEKIVENL